MLKEIRGGSLQIVPTSGKRIDIDYNPDSFHIQVFKTNEKKEWVLKWSCSFGYETSEMADKEDENV